MERNCFVWLTLFASIFEISYTYLSPNDQYEFVPENHPNWNNLDHTTCGFSLKKRIIGGKDAYLGQYPWVARLGRISTIGSAKYLTFSCGASILNRYYVITAAHCFLDPKIKEGELPCKMERNCFVWLTLFASIFEISYTYLSPNDQYEFVPENHPNWNKLDHTTCGFSLKNRIIGGKDAHLGQYPWLARMGRIRTEGSAKHVLFPCGASILNRYYVITAAHCFLEPEQLPNMVRLGEYNTGQNPDCEDEMCAPKVQDIRIKECYVPNHFDTKSYANDIALCLLTKPIQFNEVVSPICLMPSSISRRNMTGEVAEVAGWGLTDVDTIGLPKILQTVKLQIVGEEQYQCSRYKKLHGSFPTNILCAGTMAGKDSCAGDSGGPLMVPFSDEGPAKYYIVGIVSYGKVRCGEQAVAAVYTNVAQYLSWILDLINKE